MKKKKYEVQIYYSTFCSHQVEAINKEEAFLKARRKKLDDGQILSNIEEWNNADTIEEI